MMLRRTTPALMLLAAAALWPPSLVEASDATEADVWGEAMIVDVDRARADEFARRLR